MRLSKEFKLNLAMLALPVLLFLFHAGVVLFSDFNRDNTEEILRQANCSTKKYIRYTLHKNETFSSISEKFGISVKVLEECNKTLDPYHLPIGEVIIVPLGGSSCSGIEQPFTYTQR